MRKLLLVWGMLLTVVALSPLYAGIDDSTELFSHSWSGDYGDAINNGVDWLERSYDISHPQTLLKDTLVLDFTWHDRGMDSPWYNETATKDFRFTAISPFGGDFCMSENGTLNLSKDNNHYRFEYAVPEAMLHMNDNWLKDPANENFNEQWVESHFWVKDDARPVDDTLTMRVSTYDSGRYVNDGNTADQPVPEPGTLAMMGTGLFGMIGYEVRRRKAKRL